jgi:hypothetical protein
MVDIYCEICFSLIARVKDLSSLKIPLHGNQFLPPYDGMSSSHLDGKEYKYMTCPICNKRPFLQDDRVMTSISGGYYTITPIVCEIEEEVPKGFICEKCKRKFKTEAALKAHKTRESKKRTHGKP